MPVFIHGTLTPDSRLTLASIMARVKYRLAFWERHCRYDYPETRARLQICWLSWSAS